MKTVLLIGNDAPGRGSLAEMLRRGHWKIIEAPAGESGLHLALQNRPDVILCDWRTPPENGSRVCLALRQHVERRGSRMIVITGQDDSAGRTRAEELGADEWLAEPIDLDQLHAALAGQGSFRLRAASPAVSAGTNARAETGARVRFWGVRGSIPTPGPGTVFYGGNTSCIEIRADGEHLVCDAGSGIRALGLALAEEFKGRPLNLTLLVTHTHWEHIQGFPFFVPAYQPHNHLRIVGYAGVSDSLRATLAGQMESPYFPVALDAMPGNIEIEELKELEFSVGSIPVRACFTNHSGVCAGYRFETSAGSIVYMPDHETQCGRGSRNGTPPSSPGASPRDFIEEADLVILDAQYTAEEYQDHVDWGHGCVDEVVHLAVAARVKRLFLFHHDPAHDDCFMSGMLVHARKLAATAGSELQIEAAREGEEVVLAARPAIISH